MVLDFGVIVWMVSGEMDLPTVPVAGEVSLEFYIQILNISVVPTLRIENMFFDTYL
jgi:hypothetical protein